LKPVVNKPKDKWYRLATVKVPLALCASGLVIYAGTLAFVRWQTGRFDGHAFRSLDSREYFDLARNLADHGTFSQSAAQPMKPATWRTPGYPLFLAAVMKLAGPSPVALIIAQHLLGILNVLLVFRIARAYMSANRAALTALLFLFEPYHLFYTNWLMSETLFTTVILLTWLAWQRCVPRIHIGWSLAVGLLSGALILIRPLAILVPIALAIAPFLRALKTNTPRRKIGSWLTAVAVLVGSFLIVGSWVARNRVVAGHWAISEQGGIVLAYFKATEVILWREGRTRDRYLETSLDPAARDQPHVVWERIDAGLRERIAKQFPHLSESELSTLHWSNLAQGNKTPIDSFEISRALGDWAVAELMKRPLSTFACCAARCLDNLTFPLGLATHPPSQEGGGSRLQWAVVGAVYTLLLLAAIAGLLRSRPRPTRQDRSRFSANHVALFPVLVLGALLLTTTPQVEPRFRVPLIPLMAVVAMLPRRVPDQKGEPNAE